MCISLDAKNNHHHTATSRNLKLTVCVVIMSIESWLGGAGTAFYFCVHLGRSIKRRLDPWLDLSTTHLFPTLIVPLNHTLYLIRT